MDELAHIVVLPESRFDELRAAGQQGLSLCGADEKVPEHYYHLDEGFRSPYKHHEDEEEMHITGAAAATTARKPSKTMPASTAQRDSAESRKSSRTIGQFNGRRRTFNVSSNNNNEEDAALRKQRESEVEQLREDAARWKRELQHVREEKREIEEAFRRLDQEIANGYNLVERKEKELKIAELVTKNQKVAQLLEKELKAREELRASHIELLSQHQSQTEQLTLLHGVFSTLEAKHASLKEAHATLKSSYEAALVTIEQLQDTVNQVQAKLIHAGGDQQQQRLTDYEQKLQSWERKYSGMERKCVDLDHRVQVLTQELESLLENKAHLEREVGSAHDQLIRMTGFVKTMEAKLEVSIQDEQARVNMEKLYARIRSLESELLTKTRAYADLKQTFDEYLSGTSGAARKTSSSRGTMFGRALSNNSSASQPGSSRLKAMSSRVATLGDKLRAAEEERDRKARNLDVLMQAFPFLLQQLDALQDKFHAAAESNEILKSALEQMQQRPPDEDGSTYLRLAQENYLLNGPYQIDLLTGYTGAAAFSQFPSQSLTSAAPKAKNFAPFRVVSDVKRKNDDNQQGEDEESRTVEQFAIVADANDANGASYLNRSKINAFLQFIQSHAAKKNFKELIFTKLAEYITKLRELKFQFGAETTTQRATIQMLQREVDELKHKLNTQVDCLDAMPMGKSSMSSTFASSPSSRSRRKLLMKLIDVYVEKQQLQHRQSTFLTQTNCSSDILISNGQTMQEPSCDCLDLSECGINDDDIVEVLLKIQVSGVAFYEIRLDGNALTDGGATRLAHFLEKCPSCVKIVSVNGNALISYHGIDAMKQGLLRNRSIQRVAMDPSNHVIEALAAQDEFALHGNPTVVLRVVLPKPSHAANTTHASEDEVNQMVDRMHQMGFAELRTQSRSAAPASSSFAIYGATSLDPRRKRVHNSNRIASAQSSLQSTSTTAARRQSARQHQELKFQHLEAAIRRATAVSKSQRARTSTVAASRPRHATITSIKRVTLWGSHTSGTPRMPVVMANGSRAAISGKAHLAMVRGLQR